MIDPLVDALLPPAILAILAALFLAAGRAQAAALALALLTLLSVNVLPHVLIVPLLGPADPAPPSRPAAIVVFDIGNSDYLDPSRTEPGIEAGERLRAAAALFRRTATPILLSGPPAAAMASSLQTDFRVPAAWTDAASANLWQSAAASATLLRGAGIDTIYLVAHPWEFRLAAAVFRAAGLAVVPAPIAFGARRPLDLTALVAFTPAWLEAAVALRQWTGLACQALPPCVAWMLRPTPGPS